MQDESTYGFSKADASDLLSQIGGHESDYREGLVRSSKGGGSAKLVLATSGIPARSGTTVGSATCTEYKIVGSTLTTNTETITVKNIQAEAIPSGLYVFAVKEALSGFWIAQHPGVLNVRWNDPDLQQTKNGTSYTNIDTAEDCA